MTVRNRQMHALLAIILPLLGILMLLAVSPITRGTWAGDAATSSPPAETLDRHDLWSWQVADKAHAARKD